MATYKKESHLRSLLKGISWRIIATTDTILVVLLITCLFGQCSIQSAIAIGAAEFLIKLAVYYVHERLWQGRSNARIVSKHAILYKTLSWRAVATTMTFIISGAVLESFDEIAMIIAVTELFTKFALYYVHERIWLTLPLGKIRNSVYKFFGR
ncbi:hypothetical protein GCM10009117_03860 [Gangjinia marincola]|uniref:DUF2061 domain-containing protein n=1 Tax=Gangjinia marincola TaxID=578463 RepID=A0ABP3XPK9_9FLAO